MKIKHKKIKSVRNVLKFAWLPTEVRYPPTGDIYTIWLEKYYESQKYSVGANYYDSWAEWVTYDKWIS